MIKRAALISPETDHVPSLPQLAKKKAKRRLYLVVLTLLLAIYPDGEAFAMDDKIAHASVSAVLGIAGETYLHHTTDLCNRDKVFFGFLLGLTPGVMKEIYDSTQKEKFFNGKDLAADIVGAFAGSLFSNFVNNALWISVDKTASNHVTLSISCKF